MHTFEFIRPPDAAAAIAAAATSKTAQQGARRPLHRRRHDAARPDEAERRDAGAAHRHQPLAARQDRSDARRRPDDRRDRPQRGPRPPSDRATGLRRAVAGASRRAPRRSFATWRRRPATCSSGRAACTSATPRCPATSASRERAVPRSPAATGRWPSSARASSCIATNPSDMYVAMAALEATIHVRGTQGRSARSRSATSTSCRADTPHRETVLEPGDLITHVTLPPPVAGSKQAYLKLRDRASYEFALASAAVVMTVAERESDPGADRAGRRRHQALAIARGRGGARRAARRAPRASARPRKRRCATPSRRARTDSRSSWRNAASRTRCRRPRRRPDSLERTQSCPQ